MNTLQRRFLALVVTIAGCVGGTAAEAANIVGLSYEAQSDSLVIQIVYRGTHPDHQFSVEWAQCRQFDQGAQILGLLVDSDPKDPAREDFSKVLRISLAQQSCRPAQVIIRTDAGFLRSVDVPAARR